MSDIRLLRAKAALAAVNRIVPLDADVEKLNSARPLRAAIRSLGPMIRTNGLAQAIAFFLSRTGENKESHAAAAQLLHEWLAGERGPFRGQRDPASAIASADLSTYLAAQAEALEYLPWLSMVIAARVPAESKQDEKATA